MDLVGIFRGYEGESGVKGNGIGTADAGTSVDLSGLTIASGCTRIQST